MRTFGIVLVTVLITVALTIFVLNRYVFPKKFSEVELSQKEERVLNSKLKQFGLPAYSNEQENAEPEVYTEENATREINFTEKELNALLAKNTDIADRVVIDLSANLASAKAIIPLDQDFPVLGGKTVKVTAGLEMSYAAGRPVIILKGVSLWGVPIPNAWLGNLKNVDLVKEFGGGDGAWKSFADGIDNIHVAEGILKIKLKE